MTWYDLDYGYKKKITIDHTKVDGDETDFPVLVSVIDNDLRDTGNGGHVLNSNGYDIIFTNDNEDTQLKHEIERYVNTNGLLVFWVKVDSLSSTEDTDLYIYYGKIGVSADPSTTDTWDSNFISVHHMNQPSGNLIDSTINSNDGTGVEGFPSYQQPGISNSYCGKIDTLNDAWRIPGYGLRTSDFTIEFWFECDNWRPDPAFSTAIGYSMWDDTYAYLLANKPIAQGGTGNPFARWRVATTNYTLYYTNSPDTINWHAYSFVYDNDGNAETFYDGSSANTDSNTGNIDAQSGYRSNVACITLIGQPPRQEMFGSWDEIRVSDMIRSSNWLGTSYNTINSPGTFMSLGSELERTFETFDSVDISDNITLKYKLNLSDTLNISDIISATPSAPVYGEAFDPRRIIRTKIATNHMIDGELEECIQITDNKNKPMYIPIYFEEKEAVACPALPYIRLDLLAIRAIPHNIKATVRQHTALIGIDIAFNDMDNIDVTRFGKKVADKIVDLTRQYQIDTDGIQFYNVYNQGRIVIENRCKKTILHWVMELEATYSDAC